MHSRKICVVTGSRADYGLLHCLMQQIVADPDLELQVVATGMHLSPEFGLTYRGIEEDGFTISAKVEMLLSSDTGVGIAKSIGLGVMGLADALERLCPDLLLVLGDRYEILAAVQAALVARVPVAHIAGGDTTEGAFDESIRHSITKLSHLHFVTNELAARRVRQLGENPAHVYNVGSPGIDRIKQLRLLGRNELQETLGFRFREKNLLVTFHPATLDPVPAEDQFRSLLEALDMLGSEVGLIFTLPNADNDGRIIIEMTHAYAALHDNARAYPSLGQLRYLSAMAQVDAVVGNSSSALYEAPTLKRAAVNIGDRQKGRLQGDSVVNCPADAPAILRAIREALGKECSATVNPYGDGGSSQRIVRELKSVADFRALLQKRFFLAEGAA